jgi:hypothetical protein
LLVFVAAPRSYHPTHAAPRVVQDHGINLRTPVLLLMFLRVGKDAPRLLDSNATMRSAFVPLFSANVTKR